MEGVSPIGMVHQLSAILLGQNDLRLAFLWHLHTHRHDHLLLAVRLPADKGLVVLRCTMLILVGAGAGRVPPEEERSPL